MQEVIQVFKLRNKMATKFQKIKLKQKKFKVVFKTFLTFKVQSFIISKFTKLIEFSLTFCFFELFQMFSNFSNFSCLKKPIHLSVHLKSKLKFSCIVESSLTCSKIKISINWTSFFVNSRFQEVTKFLLTFPMHAAFLIFNPFEIMQYDLFTSRNKIW